MSECHIYHNALASHFRLPIRLSDVPPNVRMFYHETTAGLALREANFREGCLPERFVRHPTSPAVAATRLAFLRFLVQWRVPYSPDLLRYCWSAVSVRLTALSCTRHVMTALPNLQKLDGKACRTLNFGKIFFIFCVQRSALHSLGVADHQSALTAVRATAILKLRYSAVMPRSRLFCPAVTAAPARALNLPICFRRSQSSSSAFWRAVSFYTARSLAASFSACRRAVLVFSKLCRASSSS